MIIKGLLSLVITLVSFLFSWVSFPAMPVAVTQVVDTLLNAISGAMGFIWLIVPKPLVMAVLPIILIVENFDKLYSVVMWIVRKIPLFNMS